MIQLLATQGPGLHNCNRYGQQKPCAICVITDCALVPNIKFLWNHIIMQLGYDLQTLSE